MTTRTRPGRPAGTRVVVVGHGMVGARFVDDLRARDPEGRFAVTVLGAEPYGAYNRILLSEVVAGRADVASLSLSDTDGLRRTGVDVRLATAAVSLDRRARVVHTDDGGSVGYDLLVLATGSRPFVPPLAGLADGTPAGVHAFRTVDDCREIVAATTNARRAVVLGGGLLGIEAARGLAGRGVPVTVVHPAPRLMERQLDDPAGRLLARSLRGLGIDTLVGTGAAGVVTAGGRLTGLTLTDGRTLEADLLLLTCGVLAEDGLARDAGLPVDRGVVVDAAMTSPEDPHVTAIGDCARAPGGSPGLVSQGWEQARVLADRVTGADPSATFEPAPAVARLKASGLDVTSAGDVSPDPWDDELPTGTEVVALSDPARGSYAKAVLRDDRVVAAVCVGAPETAAALTQLIDRGTPAPRSRAALLTPGVPTGTAAPAAETPTRMPDRATVCRCNGVTKGAVVAAWSAGARSTEAVSTATRAATGCGGCRGVLAGIVDWLAAADGDGAHEHTHDPNRADEAPDAGTAACVTESPATTGGSQ